MVSCDGSGHGAHAALGGSCEAGSCSWAAWLLLCTWSMHTVQATPADAALMQKTVMDTQPLAPLQNFCCR